MWSIYTHVEGICIYTSPEETSIQEVKRNKKVIN